MTSPRDSLERLWQRYAALPGGKWLFSRAIGWFIPYSGSIGATVEELRAGHCRTTLRDRRSVRNHLNSVHAVALVNLGEMTSGLAMTMALPPGIRGIVTSIGAEYLHKARGRLVAEARVTLPDVGGEPVDTRVETAIANADGLVVCRVFTVWRLDRR